MDLKKKAIRVGISVSLCMLMSDLLKLKFPFFVLLPAVMPISTFFGETIKFGINRIIGSSIGALIGVILVTIQLQNILLVGLGVILIIYVCNYLKWDSTTSIACLVFSSIMTGVKGSSALIYSAHRLFDTFIGIAITTVVNSYIFNPDMKGLLKEKTKKIQEKLLDIASTKDFFESENELSKIEWELNNIKEKLKIYDEEFKLDPKFSLIRSKLENMIYTISIIFDQIKTINYMRTNVDTNDIDIVISVHKNIFFSEMNNLNRILNDTI